MSIDRPTIAVVMPAYNEGPQLARRVAELLERQDVDELIVVDASDDPGSQLIVRGLRAAQGSYSGRLRIVLGLHAQRATQMNQGASGNQKDVLVFLHADTRLPGVDLRHVLEPITEERHWARFSIRIDARGSIFRLIEAATNYRSCWSGIATGDQAISVRRTSLEAICGFRPMALMEDVDLSRRLKQFGRPLCLSEVVLTSARRWRLHGVVRTIALMWLLRLLFSIGISDKRLASWYGDRR